MMTDVSAADPLKDLWWYYTVERAPGEFYQGIYPDDMVLLPRLSLSEIDLSGMDAIDVCTMEGIIPTLMCKSGARRVVAADSARPSTLAEAGNDTIQANREKLSRIQSLHDVKFDYEIIPERTPASDFLGRDGSKFDVVNLSGLLYHVFSPMHWIGSVRPLVRDNGLVIISTNVTLTNDYTMTFNERGALQDNLTTYWYLSIPLFDYMLRYFRLRPVRCKFAHVQPGGAYMSVVCRAEPNVIADPDDAWMEPSAWHSWDSKWWGGLTHAGPKSQVRFKDGGESEERLSLWRYFAEGNETPFRGSRSHTAVLHLNDSE